MTPADYLVRVSRSRLRPGSQEERAWLVSQTKVLGKAGVRVVRVTRGPEGVLVEGWMTDHGVDAVLPAPDFKAAARLA